ncbi:MAG: alpha/beta hydrolase [Planctomycetaceae bacterium]|nr:alpha/beta hydrolase [Planctomycetaceae bacterium]
MLQSVRSLLGLEGAEAYRRSTPLILVNGLAEQGESWFRSREAWARSFDVHMPALLVYDGPVLQEWMRRGNAISVDFLTDRLASYLDNFVQTAPYHLVASSLGGQIVIEYAARYPEKVGRMVLICPSGMGGVENLPIVEGVRHHDYTALVKSCFHDPRLASPQIVAYYKEKFSSRAWRKAMLQTVRGTKKHSVREKLPHVTCQTLVICGREDQIVDPFRVRDAVKGLPNFKVEMIPRCGHAPQLEVPQIVNPLVSRFLQEGDVTRKSKPQPKLVAEAVAAGE